MKEKIRMAAGKLSALFGKVCTVIKRPFLAFYEKHQKGIQTAVRIMNRYSLVFHWLWAMLLEFLIEAFSRHSALESLLFLKESPLVFFYNTLLIFMTLMIVYLFRRRLFVRLGISAVWLYGGYMNGTVLSNRVTPFTAQDIKLLEDLVDILDKYMSPDKLIANVMLVVIAVTILYLFWKKGPKYQGKIHHVRNLFGMLAVIAVFAGSTYLALENRILSSYFGNIAFAYEDYGFPYCFCCTLVGTGMSKPYDYSEESIEALTDWEEEVPEELPNIIFVQLETFFDVDTVEWLNFSEEPIPHFRSLMKNYSSGAFKVPSVGAGTANTEFETISGMNMRYFGPGEYPHKTILKKTTCDSIPYALKEIGYSTHAIHNNKATFYSRADVFPNLGFETFTSKEYMDISEQTPTGWLKDEVLIGSVMDCLQSTEGQDYVFAISVQGHGDYPKKKVLEDPVIEVSGAPSKSKNNQWEYYVNQLHEMDQFVQDLIDTVNSLDEKSVIVFYGDHLPTLDLTEEDVTNRYLFDTSYVIWDNLGLEKEDGTLCAYQIGAEVLDRLGIHTGAMVQYHQNRRGTKNYQYDMEILQYDLLYGKGYGYGEEGFHEPADMTMGIIDQTIDKVVQIQDKVYVFGENFTTQSKVFINDEFYSTGFVNENLIWVADYELQDGDQILIRQLAPNKRVLSEEMSVVYRAPVEPEPVTETENEPQET